jgi:hypothetical protein
VNKKFGKQVLFTPHYMFSSCDEECDAKYRKTNCFADGKYCVYDSAQQYNGREIMYENIR